MLPTSQKRPRAKTESTHNLHHYIPRERETMRIGPCNLSPSPRPGPWPPLRLLAWHAALDCHADQPRPALAQIAG